MNSANANTNTNTISLEREAKSAILLLPPDCTLGEHEKGKQGKGQIVMNTMLNDSDGDNNSNTNGSSNGSPRPRRCPTTIFLERYVIKTIYGHFYRGREIEYKIQIQSASQTDNSTEMNMIPTSIMENHDAVGIRGNAKAVKCVYVHKYNQVRKNSQCHRHRHRRHHRRRHHSEDPDNEIAIKAHIKTRSSTDVAFDNHIILPQYVLTNRDQNQEHRENEQHQQHQQEQQEHYYFIVSHLADGGDLIDKLRRMDICRSKYLFRQMSKGVKYLHDLNIFHRDLKPDNIVTHSDSRLDDSNSGSSSGSDNDGVVDEEQSRSNNQDGTATSTASATHVTTTKENNAETHTASVAVGSTIEQENVFIIDFGQAQVIPDGADEIEKIGNYGTIFYTAPEFSLSHPSPLVNWRKADVWALGVTLYIMLVKQFPPWKRYNRHNKPVLINPANSEYQYICRREKLDSYLQCNNIKLPKDAVDLLQKMLLEDVNQRISMSNILSHPWLRE